MSSPNQNGSLEGHSSSSELTVEIGLGDGSKHTASSPEMSKRVAARELILQYYSQLTEGCGNDSCTNENCASSNVFRFGNIDRNKLAVEAITLSKAKAELCETRPSKVSRLPSHPNDGDSEVGGPSGLASTLPASSSSSSTSISSSISHTSLGVSAQKPGGPVGQGAKAKIPTPTSVSSSARVDVTANSSSTKEREPEFLTEEKLTRIIAECESKNSWSKLIHIIGAVYNNPESILKSFHVNKTCADGDGCHSSSLCSPHSTPACDNQKNTIAASGSALMPMDCSDNQHILTAGASAAGQSSSVLSACRLLRSSDDASGQTSQSINNKLGSSPVDLGDVYPLDLKALRQSYAKLAAVPEQPFQGALINALLSLSPTMECNIKYNGILERDPDYILALVVVLEIPMLHWPEYLDSAFPAICRVVGQLPVASQARLAHIWAGFDAERLTEMVHALQQLITVKIINNEGSWSQTFRPGDIPAVVSATRVLKIIYYACMIAGSMDSSELIAEEKILRETESLQEHMQGAFGYDIKEATPPKEDPLGQELGVNAINCREPVVPWDDFVNEPLNDNLDIGDDYINHRPESENKFSFVPYHFILTTASKHTSMYYDNRIRMLQERRSAIMQSLVHGGLPSPFLRLRVRRDHIVDDALVNLEMIAMENPSDLRKQLFVEFEEEQGLDEGGVSKEFFQLIVEELFNPDIGMFTYNEESHHFWFNSMSFENDGQFTLIGILLGLAIYNSCILDIHFPMVVYRKLMGKKGTFKDLYDMDPTLLSSLQAMLDYDGDDLEDVFEQTFRIGYSNVFGENLTHDLKDGGENIPVTQDNKQEFVDLYADYLLNKSIEQQFRAFKRGFLMVTAESPLRQMFRPDEIELLVCGSKNFDFQALEKATTYDGGFTEDSTTIRNFWTVVHEMQEDEKRKLLQFTTGTDRVPVGGLSKLRLIVARNGPDSDRLPTSHTCFNVLLLPEYSSLDKLRDRLLKAINYSKGFGML